MAASSSSPLPVIIHQFRPAHTLEALCRFSSTPFQLLNSSHPHYESTGELPQLQHGSVVLGRRKALQYLRQLTGLDSHLSAQQLASCEALSALVASTLQNVELWCLYGPEERFNRITAPGLRSALLAPLSLFHVTGLRNL